MASVNAGLIKHNLILALDDRGKVSCHKVNLCFIYMNNTQCIVSIKISYCCIYHLCLKARLEKILNEKPDEQAVNGAVFDREAYLRNVEEFEDVEVDEE